MNKRLIVVCVLVAFALLQSSAAFAITKGKIYAKQGYYLGRRSGDQQWFLKYDNNARYPWQMDWNAKRAAGSTGLYINMVQTSNVLTDVLRGGYFVAQPGSVGGTGNAKLVGVEAKVRTPDSGVPTAVAFYASADQKDQTVTTLRGMEVSLDGDAGGSTTTTQGVVVFGNSSGSLGNSYGFSVNAGAVSGHNTFTADIQLQNGELIDNATDGIIALTATTVAASGVITSGGGYGSTGVTLSTAGAIQCDGRITSVSSLSSQTTENIQGLYTLTTDSTWSTGTNLTYSGARGSSILKLVGTYTGVNGMFEGIDCKVATSGAHTTDGKGTMGIKSVVTNSAAMSDGEVYGGQFIAKHSHATNDMLASASLIGIEGWAYPANVGHVQTFIGGNFGYHIEATTEDHLAGSVARGVQIFCDDASSNVDPFEETHLCLWNMTGDQDYGINFVKSASGWTTDIKLQNGETIVNSTDGVIDLTATEVNVIGYLTSDNDGSAIDSASGRTMITGYYQGGTTALTSEGVGVYGNARVTMDSAAGTLMGGFFKAGNGTGTGYDIKLMRGIYVEGVKKAGSGAVITAARGIEISMDWDAATTTTTTLTGLRVELQSGASSGTNTHTVGIHVTNQSVSGAGEKFDAAILVTQLSCGSAAGFDYGLDMGDSSFPDDGITFTNNTFGTADIRLSSGATIRTGTGSPDGSLSAVKGSLYIQIDGSVDAQLWVNEDGSTAWGYVDTT